MEVNQIEYPLIRLLYEDMTHYHINEESTVYD